VQVLDIYAASEEPIAGVDAPALVREIAAVGACTAEYAKSMRAAVATLAREAGSGDVILTLGAGSISQAGPMLLEALAANG
jgi:UDP-N-acetylmuramate--alanine ligase